MTAQPVLGIWGYSSDRPETLHHDSGAALVSDGRILAAVNEERITRRKNEGRWPVASIDRVLEIAGVRASEVGAVAMAGLEPIPRGLTMARELASLWRSTGILLPNRWLYAALTAKKIVRTGPRGFASPRFIGHHDAHAASAYFTSPWDRCAVVTLDGIGDSAHCGAVYRAEGGRLTRLRTFSGYASPGILYSYVTKAFGFRPARHEGKITGLAGRGNPEILLPEFRKRLRYEDRRLVSDFIPRLFGARVDAEWATTWIDELLDRYSREDIAAALQALTEELAAAIARDALEDTGCPNIALAGGVFANVRVNQVVRQVAAERGGNCWIHPNMGDGGLGAGAALAVAGNRSPLADAYLGDEAGSMPDGALEERGLVVRRPADLGDAVAGAVTSGLIVGRCAGRMEYGPRALGHRTIFADVRDASINDTLNQRLRRTEFMPFAPIMSEKAARELLEGWSPDDAASRYMTITYHVRPACRNLAPAIVHVDNTARPQVVPDGDAFLNRFLAGMERRIGAGIAINTSFNIHEEPIVRSCDDAVRSWEQGAVDLLAFDGAIAGRPDALARAGL